MRKIGEKEQRLICIMYKHKPVYCKTIARVVTEYYGYTISAESVARILFLKGLRPKARNYGYYRKKAYEIESNGEGEYLSLPSDLIQKMTTHTS